MIKTERINVEYVIYNDVITGVINANGKTIPVTNMPKEEFYKKVFDTMQKIDAERTDGPCYLVTLSKSGICTNAFDTRTEARRTLTSFVAGNEEDSTVISEDCANITLQDGETLQMRIVPKDAIRR